MKKILKITIAISGLLALFYTGVWFYIGLNFTKEINQFYETEGAKQGYKFYGDKPALSGFPLKPIITYNKGFSKNEIHIQFEKLEITAIPFPAQPLDIKIKTLAIQDSPAGQLYEIDEIKTTLIIPDFLPRKMTQEQLIPWQKEIGKIDIQSLEINKNSMITTAQGFIGLDQNLQPILNLDTTITDYDKLIRFMSVETSELKPLTARIALSVLNSLAKTDKVTGKKFVQLDVQIKKRRLIAGSIKTIRIPKIDWPEKL